MSASGGAPVDRSIGKCLELQPEIVSYIISFLEDTDVVTASGVCWQWYHAASRELRLREKALYRWPGEIPSSARSLCMVGEKGISQVLQLCKGITVLEISFDEPRKLTSKVITKASQTNLKKLKLRNIIFNSENARALLSSEIPDVEIYTKYKKHVSRKSRKMLLDNKELFTSIVFSSRQPHPSFYGVYPNPVFLHRCDTFGQSKVILEAKGVTELRFSSTLTHFIISNGFHLTGKDFLQLSTLNLKTFAVSHCNISEEEWSASFQNGFIFLSFLSITDCIHLGLDTIRHISGKTNLSSLQLDLRYLTQIGECILILQDSVSLINFNLCTRAYQFNEGMFFEKKWKKLKKIAIRNYGFIETKKEILDNLEQKYKLNGILVKYYNSFTVQESNIELNKNLLPILVN
ncbi:uncharacterized protein [Halyomorpha halys]|uniref:uncharacterized protein n=1 Tax=Halyomorpha halys TaxID=286706 RepID=UPI0006D4CDD9